MNDLVDELRNMDRFNDRREYGDSSPSIWSEAADEIERLRADVVQYRAEASSYRVALAVVGERMRLLKADAARWRYVRDNLMRGDPKMDGTSYWFFRNPLGRGRTPDEEIDRRIQESKQ